MNTGIVETGLNNVLAKLDSSISASDREFRHMTKRIEQITVAKSVSNAPISPTKGQYEASIRKKRRAKSGKKSKFKSAQSMFNPGGLQRSVRGESDAEKAVIFVPSNSEAGKYADFIHNGSYNLGIGSEAKKSAGHDVGPGFIKRAIDTLKPKYLEILKATADKLMP